MITNTFKMILSLLVLPLLLISCSGSKENENNQNGLPLSDSTYVFDQPVIPTKPDSISVKPKEKVVVPPKEVRYYYVVQIGAFTTKERATEFADSAKKNLNYQIEISYSSTVNLYVVHLLPDYSTKEEAAKTRDELWKMNKFKDAWVLTVRK